MSSLELLNRMLDRRSNLMIETIKEQIHSLRKCIDEQYIPKIKRYKRRRIISYVGYIFTTCFIPASIGGLYKNTDSYIYCFMLFIAAVVYVISVTYDSHCKTMQCLYKNATTKTLQTISNLEDRLKNL